MTIDYDPFSPEAMADPHPFYSKMRAQGCPFYVKKRNAWALTMFDDLRKASTQNQWLDFTAGQTPAQLMLGEPIPHTFMTTNVPENRKWRGLLEPFYSTKGVEAEIPRIRSLIDRILDRVQGQPTLDVYADFANKVMCINAGHNLGFDSETSEAARGLIDRMILNRSPDQLGGNSDDSQGAAMELGGIIMQHVQKMRKDKQFGGPHGRVLRDAVVDGKSLNDQDLFNYIFSLLVVGSETTPMAVAATLYYLGQSPVQKQLVLNDHSLLPKAFREACRIDQPTNMLARRAAMDFNLNGAEIKEGQSLLFLYASANRDETRFSDADQFDILRENRGDMTFGFGAHFCLGSHLAQTVATLMISKLFEYISDYTVDQENCQRAFGEHLSGFIKMPIRPIWK